MAGECNLRDEPLSSFVAGTVYVPSRPPAIGIDKYLYDVAIGPGNLAGSLWFEVYRSKRRMRPAEQVSLAPSYAVLTQPDGEWVRRTNYGQQLGTSPVPVAVPLPTAFPNLGYPDASCGPAGLPCAWDLATTVVGGAVHATMWVGVNTSHALQAVESTVQANGTMMCWASGLCAAGTAVVAAGTVFTVLGHVFVGGGSRMQAVSAVRLPGRSAD